MIPRIHQAELLKEDMWLVFFMDESEPRFPIMRVVPTTENPETCPGGELWCKQFGCVPGDNVFTRAKTEIIVEEGQEIPVCDDCGLNMFECEHQEWKEGNLADWKDELL